MALFFCCITSKQDVQKQKQYNSRLRDYMVKKRPMGIYLQGGTKNLQIGKKMGYTHRFVKGTVNIANAFVRSILAVLGGLSGVIVVFVMVGAVLALVSTAFGVFFSPYDDTAGTRKIAEIVAETNREFYEKVENIENDIPHDTVRYHVMPDGGNQLFITNWPEVVAVFAAKTTGVGKDALDVITMDEERTKRLQEVFWDMNELSYRTEKIKRGSGEHKKTKIILHITLTSKGYEEMIEKYKFTLYQKQVLRELMQPEYAQMLSELVGALGVTGSNIELTQEEVQEMLKNLPEDLSLERRAVMEAAYSLVDKVSYFWGGKSEVIGWDNRWRIPKKGDGCR